MILQLGFGTFSVFTSARRKRFRSLYCKTRVSRLSHQKRQCHYARRVGPAFGLNIAIALFSR